MNVFSLGTFFYFFILFFFKAATFQACDAAILTQPDICDQGYNAMSEFLFWLIWNIYPSLVYLVCHNIG